MSRLFFSLYQFFHTRKIVLFASVFLFIGAGIWSAFHLDYEEDITRVMPTDAKAREFNKVLDQVRFTDKIVLSISTAQPENDPSDKLIAAGEELALGLDRLKPSLLSEITFKPEDDQIMEAFDLFYENLPLFLDSNDYAALDTATTPENIQSAMASGYRTLLSPAGSFLKKTFLRDPLSLTPRALRKLQNLKVDDRFKIEKDVIFSADGQQLMMYLQPTHTSKQTAPNGELAEELANLKSAVELSHGVKVHYFGAPLVAAGNASRIKTDINIIISVVGIFLFLFLLFFYRNPFYYFILIIPAAIGAASGFLALYLLKGTASAIAMGVGGMVLGITIDYSLHVFTHFRSVKNIKTLLEDITGGMLLSSFTTVCTFYCLLFTNSEALRDLGIFAGTGVFTAAVASLVVLPHLLKAPKQEAKEVKVNWIEKLTGYAYHKNPVIIGAGIVFSVVCVLFFSTPQFEGNPENFSYMPPELAESEAHLNKGGDVSQKAVFFITTGKTAEEALQRAENNQSRISALKEQGVISSVAGPGDLLFSAGKQQQKINQWNAFWTPEKQIQVRSSIQRSAKQLGFKDGAFDKFFLTLEKNYTPKNISEFESLQKSFLSEYITETESGFTAISIFKVKEEDKPIVYNAIGEQEGVFMFDRKKMASDLIEIIRVDLDVLVGISSIIVFVILLLSYGRLETATLTYIPLILSWVWTLGFMGILGMKFNIVNIIICTFVFGLGNDYCIFIMNGLLQDYRSGTNNLKSYKTSVFLSAFTTMLGLGGMIFSGHPALKSIAVMGVAGIGTVLFLSYAILPWLFHLLVTSKTNRGMQPLTFVNMLATLWAWISVLIGFFDLLPIGLLVSFSIFIPRKYRTRFVRILLMIWARLYIFVVFFGRKKVYNSGGEKFDKPGILVANHQSFIDVVYLFSLSPRITLTANHRIYNNPIFGPVCRMAGFLDVSQGIETMTDKIATLLKEGNIIAVFPEGTRSVDYKIHRFHKGAFKVAEETGAEIIPMAIYGTGDFLRKNEFWGRRADLHVEILSRIKPSDVEFGSAYAERTKSIMNLLRASYDDLKENKAGTRFHRDRLVQNYLYLSPVLEWYCRIKIKFENYYSDFHKNLPKKGKIYDLGCGYGFLSYMLSFMSDEREIEGYDYDNEKIITANHRFSKNEKINFHQADLTQFSPSACDGIVISDVLHYLLPEQRISLLEKCVGSLNPGGVMLIKDANTDDPKHEKTIQTENWSTQILQFNKTANVLHFFNSKDLSVFAERMQLNMQIISTSKTTSNTIWKFTKNINITDMKKVALSFLVIFFLLTGISVSAQKTYEWKEQPGTYPYKYITNDPLGARYYTLANGLTVITSVNKREPRLQTIIATKAGSKTDPSEHTGLAHYLEHMLFKGTDKYGTANWAKEKPLLDIIDGLYEKYNQTKNEAERKKIYHEIDSVSGLAAKFAIANEYDKLMASIGAKGTNAFTWFEETAYINDIPTNRIDQWLKIEAERFRNPVFRIFHTELEAVYEEKNISLDSDDEKVIDSLMGAMFRRHNYGLQTTIGTVEHLKNPSLKEIRKYYETYYVPNNMCVILAGDFNPDEMVKKVDAAFSYMKSKPVPEYTFTKEDDLKKPVEISVYGKEAEYVTFGFRFPGASDAQTDLLETLADLLSNGKAGLLDGLVTRREVLSADAGAFVLKDYSMLYFSGNPKEGQTLEEVKDLILAQVEKLKKGDFDDDLLKAIVNNRKLSELRKAEKNGGRAFDLLDAFIVGKDRVNSLRAIESTAKLTKKDITAYAQKYLSFAPVIVYKRTGEDPNKISVEKPAITPVEVNSDKESPFVKEVLAMKPVEVKVAFPDFKKEITKGKIANNELLYVKNTENDIFSLYYVVPIGYKHKPALRILEQYFGYAGAARYSAEQFDKELYKIACSVGFSVREEETFISLGGLNENLYAGYRLFKDKLKYLQCDEAILSSVKELILKERTDAKKNPDAILGKLYSYGFYEGKNPANAVLNNEELNSLQVKEFAKLMELMLESNYRILYYGPSSYQEIESLIGVEQNISLTPPPAFKPVKYVDYTLKKIEKPEVIMVNYDKVQTDILWVYNGADFKAELLPLVSLYNEYFGAGMSSVVFQEIRESKALAYSTFSRYANPSDKKYPFRFYAYIGCQVDKMGDALTAMNSLLENMPKSQGKFNAAKASLKNTINSSGIVGIDILFAYLNSEKLGLDIPINQYIANGLESLTLADIEKFQKEHIAGKPRTIIIFGDFSKMDKEGLGKNIPAKRLELEEIFGY